MIRYNDLLEAGSGPAGAEEALRMHAQQLQRRRNNEAYDTTLILSEDQVQALTARAARARSRKRNARMARAELTGGAELW